MGGRVNEVISSRVKRIGTDTSTHKGNGVGVQIKNHSSMQLDKFNQRRSVTVHSNLGGETGNVCM